MDNISVTFATTVPDSWRVLCDADDHTLAIVMTAPVFRCIYGDPLDERIAHVKISRAAMVRQAQAALLGCWVPGGWVH